MFRNLMLVALAVIAVSASAQTDQWQIDKVHSTVGFSVRHMVVAKTTGEFNEFDGSLGFDGQNLAAGTVEVNVQMASVDTDDAKRDEHLRGADFFDVANFPTMIFKSKKVIPGKDGAFQLVGDLTIRGTTKEVTFDCEFHGVINDPWGNTRAGFSAGTKINRQDFKVSWSKALDTGGVVVGDEVTVQLELEWVKAA